MPINGVPPGTSVSRDFIIDGALVVAGFGQPPAYPEWFVTVTEVIETQDGPRIAVAPQEFYLEWMMDPEGREYPLGTEWVHPSTVGVLAAPADTHPDPRADA